ncbi:Uncharacterised protein [Candidatus Bilamarchaeum dharawalense]|uniref:Uncharacterized protein n=1 Tax=Candidatus Bilamarchaeum dharawalense TaxID=2885759 RepID=A0A5E4LN72_9ARCH|nr:Uncharacterised protein [Candidatus Bilamarchaeum dharawalense]
MIPTKHQFKDGLNLLDRCFEKLEPYLKDGISHPRYRQLSGRILGLKREESKKLLKQLRQQYPIIVTCRLIILDEVPSHA